MAPLLSERMRRRSAHLDRLLGERVVAYADLLSASARLAESAMTWAAIPLADLQETYDDAELRRIISRVRVVASKDIYTHLDELSHHAHRFYLMLHEARVQHQKVRDQGDVDTAQTIQQRSNLGGVAVEMATAHKQIEAAIRKELRG